MKLYRECTEIKCSFSLLVIKFSVFKSPYLHCFFFFAGSITPTVELNGLAMKRGEPAIYRPLDPKPIPNYRANYNFRGMYNQRFVLFLLFYFFILMLQIFIKFLGYFKVKEKVKILFKRICSLI